MISTAITHRAAVGSFSAPPGVSGTAAEQVESSASSPDVVSTGSAEANPTSGWGKAAALVGVGLTVAGVGMGMASPAQAHGWNNCGVTTSQSVEYHYGHTDVIQESFNTCTGEHAVYNATHGYVTHHDYHQVNRHNHGHHGHHGHHDSGEDAAVGFLFGLGLGIILGQ